MEKIYTAPIRVYLALTALAFIGIYAAFKLPISLFPSASRPIVRVWIPSGNFTPERFLKEAGEDLESALGSIDQTNASAQKVISEFWHSGCQMTVEFAWGNDAEEAKRQVTEITSRYTSRLSAVIRDHTHVYLDNNGAALLASVYSPNLSTDAVRRKTQRPLGTGLAGTHEVASHYVWDPQLKATQIQLDAQAMAIHRLLPSQVIDKIIEQNKESYRAGIFLNKGQRTAITIPAEIINADDLTKIWLKSPNGNPVRLDQVAQISYQANDKNGAFLTDNHESLIVQATPSAGANIRDMSTKVIEMIKTTFGQFEEKINFDILINPKEIIDAAIANVAKEVLISAMLAVLVLMLFLGSIKQTITCAIEIPLSIIFSFILMKYFGVSLNLISLGGLALASGMNVDASVVVLENIFRHLQMKKHALSYAERRDLIVLAVSEVRKPVILSTITSLLVFLPLTFTSEITYAILGDLAKAVIFSHGVSLVVALILVPTVRLHLATDPTRSHNTNGSLRARAISYVERIYLGILRRFLTSGRFAMGFFIASIAAALLVIYLVPSRLSREIVGRPQSNILDIKVTSKDKLDLTQKISLAGKTVDDIKAAAGSNLQNTFSGVWGDGPTFVVQAVFKDRSILEKNWKSLEEKFKGREDASYHIDPFTPSELPIPTFSDLKINVYSENLTEGAMLASELMHKIRQEQLYDQINSDAQTDPEPHLSIIPHRDRLRELQKINPIHLRDIAEIAELATNTRFLGSIEDTDGDPNYMYIAYGSKGVTTEEDLAGFPVGVGNDVLPFSALAELKNDMVIRSFIREKGRTIFPINASLAKGKFDEPHYHKRIEEIVSEVKNQAKTEYGVNHPFNITIEDSKKELTTAISDLSLALVLSIILIIIVLSFEFASVFDIVSILIALFFGIGGVFLSLYIFSSTLSLNSILGIILLNGISIGNSIILVDLIKRKRLEMAPFDAVMAAAKDRIRPILMTSLTTILGMLPIALGYGEGGSVLKPLGIAVCGGMWISLIFTLLLVPYMQMRRPTS